MAVKKKKKAAKKKAANRRGRPRTKTSAKKTFDANVKRAEYFLDIHQQGHTGPGRPTNAYHELPRGAIVFAVGALDAYLSEVSAEVIVERLQKAPATAEYNDALRAVLKEIPTLAIEVALAGTQAARTERLRDAIAEHFHNNVSNHGAKAVAQAAARMGSQAADVWAALGTAGYQDAARDLNEWTEKRHKIVHQGQKPSVRREAARGFIALARQLTAVIDRIALQA